LFLQATLGFESFFVYPRPDGKEDDKDNARKKMVFPAWAEELMHPQSNRSDKQDDYYGSVVVAFNIGTCIEIHQLSHNFRNGVEEDKDHWKGENKILLVGDAETAHKKIGQMIIPGLFGAEGFKVLLEQNDPDPIIRDENGHNKIKDKKRNLGDFGIDVHFFIFTPWSKFCQAKLFF